MDGKRKPLGEAAFKISVEAILGTDNNINNPVRVDKDTLKKLLLCLSKNANQERRALMQLASKPDSSTGEMNAKAGVNISDVSKQLNKKLVNFPYIIKCRKPCVPIVNKFGEESNQHLWGIYKVVENEV